MKAVVRVFLVLMLVLLGGSLYIGYLGYTFLQEVPEVEGRKLYFDVQSGQSMPQVAKALEEAKIITNAKYFTWLARYYQQDSKLKAGRFALYTNWTPKKVLDMLVYGKPVLYRVTLPEGLTIWQTGKILADKGFVQLEEFMQVIKDPAFLRHYGIPFNNAEGFLMPDTYLLKRQDQLEAQEEQDAQNLAKPKLAENSKVATLKTAKPEVENIKVSQANPKDPLAGKSLSFRQAWRVAGRLVDNFWQKSQSLWPNNQKPDAENLRYLIILASIVEKETAKAQERPRVAGVYSNRLQRKMLLQADPTVIYGLGPNFSGKLLYKHLDDLSNKYNTYQHQGLPPGPICSFGTSALAAAIKPEQHQFIYFVAKGSDGSHVFSVKLEDHNKAVEQYRKWMRTHKK